MNLLHYGLQRSGTNFLETLLKKKYRVRFLNSDKDRRSPLQKHFRLYNDKDIISEPQYQNDLKFSDFESFERLFEVTPDYYLVISKDPYSWLLSYNNWAKKCNWPDVSHHYIEEYNLFYGKWLEFSRQTEKIIFIRYVDLLQNANEELSRLEAKIDLRKGIFSQFRSNVIGKVSQTRKFSNDRRSYYLSEKYLDRYNKGELQKINSLLDSRVVSQLGYETKGAV
ncbi:MAG: hypothetical protein OEU91_10525 [Gammaproteobacteria bacterium]|nr:hypothetical protein [Gammaproteobacteria bacterium]